MRRSKFEAERAQERLASLLVGGIILSVVAGVILGFSLSADSFPGTFLGLVGAWAGTALLTVALIGYGVKYGREAANV